MRISLASHSVILACMRSDASAILPTFSIRSTMCAPCAELVNVLIMVGAGYLAPPQKCVDAISRALRRVVDADPHPAEYKVKV